MRCSACQSGHGWLLAVLCLMLVTLAACESGPSPVTTPTPKIAADAQQILRMPLVVGAGGKDVASLDPAFPTDVSSIGVISQIFPGLVTLNARQQIVPWAIDALPDISADGKTYTFHIRTGLQWSDGTSITAETFAYSLNRALSPCTASPANYYLFGIKDAEAYYAENHCASDGVTVQGHVPSLIGRSLVVVDPQTLQIVLEQPAAYFLQTLCFPVAYAVPSQLIQKYGAKWTSHLADGTGFGGSEYKVTAWAHDGTLTLTRNDKFWGVKPKLREIDYTIYDTTAKAYTAYQDGKLDVGYIPVTDYQAAQKVKGFQETGVLDLYYLGLNWKIAPFNDLRARQAFALALDKKTLADSTLQGTVIATNHIVPQGMPGYNTALKGPDGTSNLDGNVTQAKQLATAYATKACGGKLSKCPAVVLTIPANRPDLSNVAQKLVSAWKAALPGWPISISTVDVNFMFDRFADHSVQFWLFDWVADYPDPQDWLSLQFLAGSANNNGSVSLDSVDTLLQRADAEQNTAQRMTDYNAAEQLLVTNVAWIPLYQAKQWWVTASYVNGFSIGVMDQTSPDVWQQIYLYEH